MVSHCTNPVCGIESRSFSSGYLYAHERQSADTKYFWLCFPCGSQFVPDLDSDHRISVMPRSRSRSLPPPRTDGYMRLVATPMRRMPWSSAVPAGLRQSYRGI